MLHVGDIGRSLLMEAHQYAALFGHVTYGEARTMTVVPGRPEDRHKHRFGLDLADVPERIEKHLFLERDLRSRL